MDAPSPQRVERVGAVVTVLWLAGCAALLAYDVIHHEGVQAALVSVGLSGPAVRRLRGKR